jgi:outer membrane scaffolding protein for murein synthesis (MipA/OmpV family)
VILARLFEPDLPPIRTVPGVAADLQPVYDGARAYRVQGGPVINIQYRDIAFIATGDGIGYNFLRGDAAAPGGKVFASWVLSKKFPMIMRVDAREFIGGIDAGIADAGVYLPLPGSSKKFVMFAGPSITLATRHYLQNLYGVTPQQSLASGHLPYEISHAGTSTAGVGFSATKFVTDHWLINLDAAISQIRGIPSRSPLVERRTQRVLALSFDYQW